jgi:hypothetical protein
VVQAGRPAGEAGTTAVERDASDAASAALSDRPVHLRARRSAAEPARFGEPDHPPDLTFVSTHGRRGFLDQAVQYHRTWGLAPQRFDSMQALLATLAGGTGRIGRLRIVSHADFDNIFTPLFDGGAAGIAEEDLTAWAESDAAGLRRTLEVPVRSRPAFKNEVLRLAEANDPATFRTFALDPANPPASGPLAQLVDASIDLLFLRSARGVDAANRATSDAVLTAELAGLRTQVERQAPPPGGTAATSAQTQALQDAITGVNVRVGISELSGATSAVAQGFRTNLDAVRARFTSASWIDIRGCRVGTRPPYLAAVATFFGRGAARPHVSGPDLFQSYPQLGWHRVADSEMARRASERNVQAALDHWAGVTGIRERLTWWLRLLGRVLVDEAARLQARDPGTLAPPGLGGGLHLDLDPVLDSLGGGPDFPPLPELRAPTLSFPRRRGPSLGGGRSLRNPLVDVAQHDIARYTGPAGLLRYYLDAALPLPVQEGSNVELMSLLFKTGLEREAIDAWTGSEWNPGAPGLAAVQSGAWTRDAIRQVEAVVDMDARRRALAMFISPDPRYAAHIRSTT